jgi:hypothetical protein
VYVFVPVCLPETHPCGSGRSRARASRDDRAGGRRPLPTTTRPGESRGALDHLASLQIDLPGHRDDAIDNATEVTRIYQRLAGTDPTGSQYQRYQPERAKALILLALKLDLAGHHE